MLCGTFYFRSTETQDWTSPQNDALWRDAVKTLFDPCPAGWRVAQSGTGNLSPWRAFTMDNGPWRDFGIGATGGREWTFSGTKIWYPACGLRHGNNGKTNNYGRYQWLWSSTPSEAAHNSYRFRYDEASVQPATGGVRGDGSPVRCIRE